MTKEEKEDLLMKPNQKLVALIVKTKKTGSKKSQCTQKITPKCIMNPNSDTNKDPVINKNTDIHVIKDTNNGQTEKVNLETLNSNGKTTSVTNKIPYMALCEFCGETYACGKCFKNKTNATGPNSVPVITLYRAGFSCQKFINRPRCVAYYTGFVSYKQLMDALAQLRPYSHSIKYRRKIEESVCMEDQFLMTLIKLKRAETDATIAMMFEISKDSVQNIVESWINFLFEKWVFMNMWPLKEICHFYIPVGTNVPLEANEDRCECKTKDSDNNCECTNEKLCYKFFKVDVLSYVFKEAELNSTPFSSYNFKQLERLPYF